MVEGKGVQSLDRAFDILDSLSTMPAGLGVTELSSRLHLHKSTVHRLLSSLAERGFVEKDERTQAYKLGMGIVEIASLKLNQLELQTEAVPYIRKLVDSIGQPAHLAILSNRDVVYIDKIEPIATIRMYSQIGKRIPVYCSSLGKALLLDLDQSELDELAESLDYFAFTQKTIITPKAFLAEMDKTRARGWGTDNEEHELGIRCIGAPVRDYTGSIIAAISLSGDKRILSPERDEALGKAVKKTADEISDRMGANLKRLR